MTSGNDHWLLSPNPGVSMIRPLILAASFAITTLLSPTAHAQNATPAVPQPYFEFQIQKPAHYIGDSSISPRPVRDADAAHHAGTDTLVVQFVVDTLGSPVAGSVKVLRAPTREQAAAVAKVVARWRFLPAEVDGHKVAQLVQTAVER
jgi:hypothetical protein